MTYGVNADLPTPMLHTYPNYFQFYDQHNLKGMFLELEHTVTADMRDLRVWMTMKLLEDPYADYDQLLKTFTDGFYGPAGRYIREYLAELEASAEAYDANVFWKPTLDHHNYLDLKFILKAEELFDQAEQAVATDRCIATRAACELSLDRAIIKLFTRLESEWISQGNKLADFPIDSEVLLERCRNTWYEQADLRLSASKASQEKVKADGEIAMFESLASREVPEEFKEIDPNLIIDYKANKLSRPTGVAKLIEDDEAESGWAVCLEGDRTKLPISWGIYDKIEEDHNF